MPDDDVANAAARSQRLAALRHAVYGPAASADAAQLAELAALENRDVEAPIADVLTAAARPSPSVTTPVSHAGDDEAHVPSPRTRPRRADGLLLAAVAVVALVLGFSMGSLHSQASPWAPSMRSLLGEAAALAPNGGWVDAAQAAGNWDAGTLRYLGAADDLHVLVGARDDGAEWCGVLVRSSTPAVSCTERSASSLTVVLDIFPTTVTIDRMSDGTHVFRVIPADTTASAVPGELSGACETLIETAGGPCEEVVFGGRFDGISVWGRRGDGDGMCVAFVRGVDVVEAGCVRDGATLHAGAPFAADRMVEDGDLVFTVTRAGDALVTTVSVLRE